jgi:hypothetical protein
MSRSDVPVILALDLGQRTGWALQLPGNILSGTVEFRPGRFEGGGMPFVRFRAWLQEMHAANQVGIVAFEEVRRHLGTAAAHSYGGFLSILTSWAEERDVPYQGVPVGTIKRHITGKGNANKAAMIEAVRNLGYDPVDDNEADAIALLHWAIDNRLDGGGS